MARLSNRGVNDPCVGTPASWVLLFSRSACLAHCSSSRPACLRRHRTTISPASGSTDVSADTCRSRTSEVFTSARHVPTNDCPNCQALHLQVAPAGCSATQIVGEPGHRQRDHRVVHREVWASLHPVGAFLHHLPPSITTGLPSIRDQRECHPLRHISSCYRDCNWSGWPHHLPDRASARDPTCRWVVALRLAADSPSICWVDGFSR